MSVVTASGSSNDGSEKLKTFKLLSLHIKGNEGTQKCAALFKQVDGATTAHDIKFSQSAGLRICIGAKDLTSEDIVKLCQNFAKYED
eukprot:216025-Ditylum_brightwellii.AAC.1